MSEIRIEPFSNEYQEQTKKLILSGIEGYVGKLDPKFNRDLDDIEESFSNGLFLVALDNESVIGTGGIVYNNGVPQIVRMSVKKEYRKHGIGKKILDKLLIYAKDKGESPVIVETTEDWTGAVIFYLRYGFKFWKYEDGDIYFLLDLKSRSYETLKEYKVVTERKSDYPNPITLRAGDCVCVGENSGNGDWKDWIWCENGSSRGWVPKQYIHDAGENKDIILENYTANELNVQEGDIIEEERILNGWAQGTLKRTGENGWVPLQCLIQND